MRVGDCIGMHALTWRSPRRQASISHSTDPLFSSFAAELACHLSAAGEEKGVFRSLLREEAESSAAAGGAWMVRPAERESAASSRLANAVFSIRACFNSFLNAFTSSSRRNSLLADSPATF